MGCRVIIGGQYGSEGKGKVVAHYARQSSEPYVVRCGGPNSGHTVQYRGRDVILRSVPAGVVNPNALLLLAAGCAIDEAVLVNEIKDLQLDPKRIVIDPRAVLISESDHAAEQVSVLEIGSTGSGVGAALIRRMQRRDAKLVGDSSRLKALFRVESVAPLLHQRLSMGGDVIVEGTQGSGLSLIHGPEYPFVTARDTNVSGFASEVGLSPRHVSSVTLVVRTFPIRVGGHSGPLKNETTWEEIAVLSGAPSVVPEYTSVTGRLRRVALFDIESVIAACNYNKPTGIAVMGVDRFDYRNARITHPDGLTVKARAFLAMVEHATSVPTELVGTGPSMDEILEIPSAFFEGVNEQRQAFTASRP